MIVNGQNILSVMNLVNHLSVAGEVHESRIGKTFELMNATIHFFPFELPYRPGMVRKLGVVEALQFLSGYFDERHIDSCVHLQYPYGIQNAYGMKVAQQLPKVLAQLNETPDSRRATLYIGKPEDGQETVKPCMQMLQFQIRDDKLHTGLFARSWDVISGMPYDVTMFNIVSQVIAKLLGLEPYGLTALAGSLHYYSKAYVRVVEKYGLQDTRDAPYGIIKVERDFSDYQEARNWAIDELNRLPKWKKGLPEGILSR